MAGCSACRIHQSINPRGVAPRAAPSIQQDSHLRAPNQAVCGSRERLAYRTSLVLEAWAKQGAPSVSTNEISGSPISSACDISNVRAYEPTQFGRVSVKERWRQWTCVRTAQGGRESEGRCRLSREERCRESNGFLLSLAIHCRPNSLAG